jgi:transposase
VVKKRSESSRPPLPADLPSAHQLIEELVTQLSDIEQENQRLQHRLSLLAQRIFGRRSEKGLPVPEQGALPFASAAGTVQEGGEDEQPQLQEVRSHRRRHNGRRPLPADLPREIVEIEPADVDLKCKSCEQEKVKIGSDSTETLDFVPASFFIREYVRPKFACASCQEGVVQAPLPARPIEKGRPEPGVLAHVVTSKYADHLPLYRIEQIFTRHGIEVTRSTLSQWNGAVADLLTPIAQAIHRQILQGRWIQTDDTNVEVQDAERDPAYHNGHMWAYRGEQDDVVYDFSEKRNRDGPAKMLAGYRGYLQADAAPAYDDIYANNPAIIEVGCWAHARRYFKEAAATARLEATQVLVWIKELYGIERGARERQVSEERRRELRQLHARPVLEKLHGYLLELRQEVLPKSPLGEAIGYALKQWTALNRYLECGALEIDNNGAERAIKPLVIGRKNWLFIGSVPAAHRTAVLCSLVNTCKAHQVNPFIYLRDVIERVSMHPMSRVDELTPRRWKELHATVTSKAA